MPLAVMAIRNARKHHSTSFDLVPANAMTVTTHLATGLLLTLSFVWNALGNQRVAYVVLVGVIFVGFVGLMYRHIERQKNIFLDLKSVVR